MVDALDERRHRCTPTPGTRTWPGTWPSCSTACRTWSPRTRWSRGGRGRPSSSAAATGSRRGSSAPPTRRADAVIAVSDGHARRRPRLLPGARPGARARHPQRHRHRLLPPRPGPRRRGRPTGSTPTGPSSSFVGRITRQKGVGHLIAAAHQFDPGAQIVLCAGAPDTPEIAEETEKAVAELSAARLGRLLGARDAADDVRAAGAVGLDGVRLPVGLRAAGHREPGGDGLRHRGGRVGRRRHPRGRRRRRDRPAGALRRERGRGVPLRPRRRGQRAARRPGAGGGDGRARAGSGPSASSRGRRPPPAPSRSTAAWSDAPQRTAPAPRGRCRQ